MTDSFKTPSEGPTPVTAPLVLVLSGGLSASNFRVFSEHLRHRLQRPLVILANSAADEALRTDLIEVVTCTRDTAETSANESALEGGWLKVADYGDWPHSRGIQRLDQQAANMMAEYFRSLRGRLARRFGGLPMYIGHPDDPGFAGNAGHEDTRAYAWIHDVEARDDGLYVLPRWSSAGRDLLANAFYKFLSPRWAMQHVEGDIYRPVRLISIGLTNQPNIPGDAIANAKTQTKTNMNEFLKKLLKSLGYSEAQAAAFANSDEGAPSQDEVMGRVDTALANSQLLDSRTSELAAANETHTTTLATVTAERDEARTALANERRERARLVVGEALGQGRVSPAAQEDEVTALANAADFAVAAKDLLARKPLLPASNRAAALGERKGEAAQDDRWLGALRTFANAHQLDLDKDYQRAHERFKATPDGQRLYDEIHHPA